MTLFTCQIVPGQSFPIPPEGYSIVDSTQGDLDKDKINELVIVYDTKEENEDALESIPRVLIIYKKGNNEWFVWKKSEDALYGSRDGGMMGDPFGAIEIKEGLLLINQNGGSSWKWGHTDKYRYQDGAFCLIGYSSTYGKNCEYWTTVDFNLLTGKMVVEKAYESCENDDEPKIYKRENETFYKKGLMIMLEKRREKEVLISTPKYKHEIYITTATE